MCQVNNNQMNQANNPAFNNNMNPNGPFGGNTGPLGGNMGPFGGNTGPFGPNNNPMGGLMGNQDTLGALVQILTMLTQVLQGGGLNNQPQQQQPAPMNQGPQGPMGAFGPNNGGQFGPNTGVAFGPNMGGAIGPNTGGMFAGGQTFGPNMGGQFGPNNGVAFGPNTGGAIGPNLGGNFNPNGVPQQGPFAPNGTVGQQAGGNNQIMNLLTQLLQALQGGNTTPNNGPFGPNGGPNNGPFGPNGPIGPNGPFGPNQPVAAGPQGVNNANNNGGVNQTVIVLGDNNGVIRQNANGNTNGAQGPMGRPAINQQIPNQQNPFQPQPQFNAQDQKAIDFINGKDGKWLVGHGQYKKDGNNFQITKGDLKDYVVKPGEGKNYEIFNPQGQKIADHAGKKENKIASPIAFDMNGDNKISTTGQTTAKDRLAGTELGETRQFDIDNNGTLDNVEWMTGNGDALLTDEQGKLFGDEGGKYNNGYEKLALRDADKDGQLTGAELNGLQLWADNGDAIQSADEMVSAVDAGVSRIAVDMNLVANERGENLMRADATINGQNVMTEDVWFGKA